MISHRAQAVLVAALFLLPAALPAAPYLIQDLHPDPAKELAYVQPVGLVFGPDDIAYFIATDPAHGAELWRSDGTPAGTYRVTDICAGRCSSDPSSLRIFQGEIYFVADDGFFGSELWATDGTPGSERRGSRLSRSGVILRRRFMFATSAMPARKQELFLLHMICRQKPHVTSCWL